LYLEHAQQGYPVTKDRRNEAGLWLCLEHKRIEGMRWGSGCVLNTPNKNTLVTKDRRNEAGLKLCLEHKKIERMGWGYGCVLNTPNKNTLSQRIEGMRRGSSCALNTK